MAKDVEAFTARGGDLVIARRDGDEAIGGDCTEWIACGSPTPVRR